MASFIIRIQLHNGEGHYEALHEAMGVSGFRRTIISNTWNKFHLPNAEYFIKSPLDRWSILERVQAIVNSIDNSAEIIVTEATAIVWSGLDPVL